MIETFGGNPCRSSCTCKSYLLYSYYKCSSSMASQFCLCETYTFAVFLLSEANNSGLTNNGIIRVSESAEKALLSALGSA